jgi:hypothetical protein
MLLKPSTQAQLLILLKRSENPEIRKQLLQAFREAARAGSNSALANGALLKISGQEVVSIIKQSQAERARAKMTDGIQKGTVPAATAASPAALTANDKAKLDNASPTTGPVSVAVKSDKEPNNRSSTPRPKPPGERI